MAEMLNCPFCNGQPMTSAPTAKASDPRASGGRVFPVVRCQDCYAEACGHNYDRSCESAIAAWNRRTPPPQAAGGEPVAYWVPNGRTMQDGSWDEGPGYVVDSGEVTQFEKEHGTKLFAHPPAVDGLWLSPLTGKYGNVLRPFLKQMEAELHANAGKGDRPGWLAMPPETAMLEIYYHVAKLQKAAKNNEGHLIIEYSADVANMAMMFLDICGGIGCIEVAHAPAQPAGGGAE